MRLAFSHHSIRFARLASSSPPAAGLETLIMFGRTTAWRLSSLLVSAPDLVDLFALAELELLFPFCDMSV